jgi:hypothetical protein
MKPPSSLLLWTSLTLASFTALVVGMVVEGETRQVFLPGQTTVGHRQLELACNTCHTQAFAGEDDVQAACEKCHSEELEQADDSHPKAKFTDPRNASRVEVLDARRCVTCHVEHQPAITRSMGVTVPEDYCFRCHSDIAEDRPSHAGMPFESCDDAGCHNFHDNRALYEDYLTRHLDAAPHAASARLPALAPRAAPPDSNHQEVIGLASLTPEEQAQLVASGHGKSGLGCADCHTADEADAQNGVTHEACRRCHEREVEGWMAGRHGMRVAAGLPQMSVGEAQIPMSADAKHRSLTCNSCHAAHATDTRVAASEACKGCHTDEHTLAYGASRHAELWSDELSGAGAAGTGVSCATCHLPRITVAGSVFVQHNQNDNLRPREKMVRSVCTQCHGVGFALAALEDDDIVRANFSTAPTRPSQSMLMVESRPRDLSQMKN